MNAVTLSGDGRHDSLGHCAKYCAYTIFCCTLPHLTHFALIRVSYFQVCPFFVVLTAWEYHVETGKLQ